MRGPELGSQHRKSTSGMSDIILRKWKGPRVIHIHRGYYHWHALDSADIFKCFTKVTRMDSESEQLSVSAETLGEQKAAHLSLWVECPLPVRAAHVLGSVMWLLQLSHLRFTHRCSYFSGKLCRGTRKRRDAG